MSHTARLAHHLASAYPRWNPAERVVLERAMVVTSAKSRTSRPSGEPVPRRFTVEQYHLMAEAGVFGDCERVELLDGEVLCMPPISDGHMGTVDWIDATLRELLGRAAHIRVQGSLILND